MERTIIFYHGGCPDGFGGAYAAWKKFGENAEYIPLTRDEETWPDITGATVYFIDFVYPKELMDTFLEKAGKLIVLDHHEGVREITESYEHHIFDSNRSGATIAWDYFHEGTRAPRFLKHLEDDDLFRFADPDTRPVMAYLGVHPFSFELFDELAETLEDADRRETFLHTARAYAEYFNLFADIAVEKAKLVSFEGHEVYFATTHPYKPMKSLVGNLLAKKQGPFALVVAAHPKGFGVSIRGDGTVDVSKIAQKYSGNGHPNSSGFLISAEGPLPWTMLEDDENPRN